MRTSERTLLSSMGFADPDKAEDRHDWACQYLCDTEERIPWSIIDKLLPQATDWQDTSNCHRQWRDVRRGFKWFRPESEHILTAGGKSTRPAAFIDAWLPFQVNWQVEYELPDPSAVDADESRRGEETMQYGRVLIEVKIRPVPLGQAVRQIKTYLSLLEGSLREDRWFIPADRWLIPVLVTAYDLSVAEVKSLDRERIKHLRLGEAFDAYCERRRSEVQIHASETI